MQGGWYESERLRPYLFSNAQGFVSRGGRKGRPFHFCPACPARDLPGMQLVSNQ